MPERSMAMVEIAIEVRMHRQRVAPGWRFASQGVNDPTNEKAAEQRQGQRTSHHPQIDFIRRD
jgi:hypothetical protein